MRLIFLLTLFFMSAFSLSLDEAKHLLNRTSFSYTKNELEKFQKFSKVEAVDYLIKKAKIKDIYRKPSAIKEVSSFKGKFKDLSREEKKALRQKRNKKMQEIRKWWYEMMIEPRFSFREKMTLFWHNHFTSEYKVVKSPFMMFEQNMLYRENALGDFSKLLHESSTDMAMLIYLDSNSNKKTHPNENYARELLELFTLGEGNYSEDDIKEAARAFTGLRVNRKKASFKVVKKHHDDGIKYFMGASGNFNGSDIIQMLLKKEQTSKFITMKLYKEFISEEFNIGEVDRLAKIFKQSSYDISILMKHLLLSEDFWDRRNRATMIKSPVEYIVSLVKTLNLKLKSKDYNFISRSAKNLGQDLFNPPSVKGWGSGRYWIDSTSLLNRAKFTKTAIKRRVNKRVLKHLDFENFDEFKKYFYAVNINERRAFKNSKDDYMSSLPKAVFNLK